MLSYWREGRQDKLIYCSVTEGRQDKLIYCSVTDGRQDKLIYCSVTGEKEDKMVTVAFVEAWHKENRNPRLRHDLVNPSWTQSLLSIWGWSIVLD